MAHAQRVELGALAQSFVSPELDGACGDVGIVNERPEIVIPGKLTRRHKTLIALVKQAPDDSTWRQISRTLEACSKREIRGVARYLGVLLARPDALRSVPRTWMLQWIMGQVNALGSYVVLPTDPHTMTAALSGTTVDSLNPFRFFPNLQDLGISSSPVFDLRPLQALIHFESLVISETKVWDVGSLASHSKLRTLVLYETRVSDLSLLAHLPHLQRLDLTNTMVSDLMPLAGLTRLTTLRLNGSKISGMEPLQHLIDTSLRVLGV